VRKHGGIARADAGGDLLASGMAPEGAVQTGANCGPACRELVYVRGKAVGESGKDQDEHLGENELPNTENKASNHPRRR